jgi:hypothetical protein
MQCERDPQTHTPPHRDEVGAERKAAILDIIRKYAVHVSLKAVDASRKCPA